MPNTLPQPHVTMALLRRYVCAELSSDENRRIASHLAECEQCTEAFRRCTKAFERVFRDLEEFSSTQQAFAAASGSTQELATSDRPNLLQWLSQLFSLRAQSFPAYAMVLLLLIGIAAISLLWSRQSPKTVVHDNSGEFKVSRDGRLIAPRSIRLNGEWIGRIESAFSNGKVPEIPDVAAFLQPLRTNQVLLGNPKEADLRLLTPVHSAALATRIRFSWTRLPNAGHYLLRIQGSDAFRWQTNVAAATNIVINAADLLRPGQVYEWSIEALVADRVYTARPQAFLILDATSSLELRRLETQLGDSALALGVVYAAYGLLGEATAEFERLQIHNPNVPQIAQWLESLRGRQTTP